MVVTPAISNLIRENKTYRIESSIQTGSKDGMFLMDETLFRLWREGLCEKEEVLLKCQKPLELADRIRSAEEGTLDQEDEDDIPEENEDDDYEDDEEDDRDDDRRRGKRRPASRRRDDDDD
jgi:twitching motility protein PilT